MKRRSVLAWGACSLAVAGLGRGVAAVEPNATPLRRLPMKMHLGAQRDPTTASMLQYFKRHGVNHICGYPPHPRERGYWTVEDLQQTRELCEQHGIFLEMIALPFLTSSHIDREKRGAIVLGQSPERDRDIEQIQMMIANLAKVGIPAFKYNMSLLGVLRTEPTPGRGGSHYSTWKLSEATPNPPLTRAGKVTAEIAWERITYFLDRIIPVCEEYKIRAACHPHDPGVPPQGYQGVCRVLGTVAGLKRFLSIQKSPYHGLNLCVGTLAEMLENPAQEIAEIIRHFGKQQQIFNIHLRNIRGHRDDFQEVYLDNGDLDLFKILRVLQEVEYPYMVMPDHVPNHPNDIGSLQGFAFGFGYIAGMLNVLSRTGLRSSVD